MSEYVDYGPGVATSTRDRTHTLFGQTMGLVAVTTGFFALCAVSNVQAMRAPTGADVAITADEMIAGSMQVAQAQPQQAPAAPASRNRNRRARHRSRLPAATAKFRQCRTSRSPPRSCAVAAAYPFFAFLIAGFLSGNSSSISR